MTAIEIPVDDAPSRLDRGRRTFVGPENPDDLATVDAKIAEFWRLHKDGAIDASEVEQIGPNDWRVTAYVWKDGDTEGRADSTGSAMRSFELDGHQSGEFPLESAQSVAIGRALRFLGILATVPPIPEGS